MHLQLGLVSGHGFTGVPGECARWGGSRAIPSETSKGFNPWHGDPGTPFENYTIASTERSAARRVSRRLIRIRSSADDIGPSMVQPLAC